MGTGARRHAFTLVEVLLALSVFTLGLLAAISLQNVAVQRLQKASRQWERQHRLTQAAEFYLLAGPQAAIPARVFPYRGTQATCTVAPAAGLPLPPVAAAKTARRLEPATLRIDLRENGKVVDSLTVDKLLPVGRAP